MNSKTSPVELIPDTAFDLIPDRVKVLHTVYSIDITDAAKEILDERGRLGEVNFSTERIRIAKQSGPNTVDTVIHELLHVVWHMFDLVPSEMEEHTILALSTGLTTIMKDNTDLFPALQVILDESDGV